MLGGGEQSTEESLPYQGLPFGFIMGTRCPTSATVMFKTISLMAIICAFTLALGYGGGGGSPHDTGGGGGGEVSYQDSPFGVSGAFYRPFIANDSVRLKENLLHAPLREKLIISYLAMNTFLG